MTDAELAAAVAGEAGELLLTLRARGASGAEADRAANDLILDRLRIARPGEFILSEESEDDVARCAASRLWVVDPLDGTSEFVAGRDDWAVHIGLSVDGVPAVGAVALPARGLVLASEPPPPPPPPNTPLRLVVSRSRPAPECPRLAETLGATLVPMGSAGAKAMAVVLGEADVYFHAGGQYAWDNCAPAAVALAAGLHVSRLDGTPLVYNCADVWLPDLLVCAKPLAPRILKIVSGVC
jgi:3'(2'), 5'-bisphosphate nucleotidase